MELIEPYLNWIYLAGIILVLLLFAWLMIRAFGGKVRAKRGARLGISEYYEVDKSRYLVLVRRDDVEHLVLIGGNQDLVIEQAIGEKTPYGKTVKDRSAREQIRPVTDDFRADITDAEPSLDNMEREAPVIARPAPRPPVFGEPRPVENTPNLRAVEHD